MIHTACKIYEERTQRKLQYKGESLGVMMVRGMECDLITKRIHLTTAQISNLWEQQNGLCSVCEEKLEEGKFEVCHIISRAGSLGCDGNALSNLALKCKMCHNDENHAQDMSNTKHDSHGHTLASHPSPLIQYILDMEGKPKQQVSGEGDDTERRDMHVYELDARSSRPNCIFEYQYPIPISLP